MNRRSRTAACMALARDPGYYVGPTPMSNVLGVVADAALVCAWAVLLLVTAWSVGSRADVWVSTWIVGGFVAVCACVLIARWPARLRCHLCWRPAFGTNAAFVPYLRADGAIEMIVLCDFHAPRVIDAVLDYAPDMSAPCAVADVLSRVIPGLPPPMRVIRRG